MECKSEIYKLIINDLSFKNISTNIANTVHALSTNFILILFNKSNTFYIE